MPPRRVLVGYDGSDRAQRAIAAAAELLKSTDAIVIHVGVLPVVVEPGIGLTGTPAAWNLPNVAAEREGDAEERARRVTDEGVQAAAASGMRAMGRTMMAGGDHDVAEAIVAVADECDAGVIVVGSHGHGPLRAALLGSVSAGVLRRAARPVLVVPQPD
jgi:nucleotide-binding universal stress UspA family protein